MIKAVIFDLWGTLIFNDNGRKSYHKLISIIGKENKKQFKSLIYNWWFTHDAPIEQFIQKVCKELKLSPKTGFEIKKTLEDEFNHAKMFRDTTDVLEELKKNNKIIGLVTNTSPMSKKVIKNLNMEKYFDFMILSDEVSVKKPNEKIYELAIEKAKVRPQECLFIGDDIQNDVGGPRKIGMKSFLINRKYHSSDNIQSLAGVLNLIDWE